MKLLYWNTKGCSDFLLIKSLLNQENPDALFLSETNESLIISHLDELRKINYEHFENPGCDRIIIIKKKSSLLLLSKQSTYYTSIKDSKNKVSIISVHLPSQMFQHIDGLKSHIRDFREEIDTQFGSSLTENILIIGDFNVNPFEKPMIDFDGFAASNSIKLRKKATHLGKEKILYYNPTWTLYKANKFPGTKYFKRPSGSSFDILEHHFLDQAVLSYYMSQNIKSENIEVLYQTAECVFFDHIKNSISLSDHLPLIYEYLMS